MPYHSVMTSRDRTAIALRRVLRFARQVRLRAGPVDRALPDLRRLLRAAGTPFRIVGGVAVVHHGYLRTTEDADVLLTADALAGLEPLLAEHGFALESPRRLRHLGSKVAIDLLFAGQPMPRPGSPPYPAPDQLGASDDDPEVVDLPGLVQLKLHAGRRQDEADVVALLKLLDEGSYLELEAAVPATLRPALVALRRDALEELAWK